MIIGLRHLATSAGLLVFIGCGGGVDQAQTDAAPQFKATKSCPADIPASRTCGPNRDDDCCDSIQLPGGQFWGDYDGVTYTGKTWDVTVSPFYLDTYEITVGRYRAFVEAYPTSKPKLGDGAHPKIPNSGWQADWPIAATQQELRENAETPVVAENFYTHEPGNNENRPIVEVSWYELFAFCAWDGGRLPTEAEWNFAAAGGDQQRVYAWSDPPQSTILDHSYSTYNIADIDARPARVGSYPKGRSRWGQFDLTGNVFEFVLDWYTAPLSPCVDCAQIMTGSLPVERGGSFDSPPEDLGVAFRQDVGVGGSVSVGARCARDHK